MSNSTKAFYIVAIVSVIGVALVLFSNQSSKTEEEHTLAVKSLLASTAAQDYPKLVAQHQVAPTRAVIKYAEDLVLCQQIKNKMPYGVSDQFRLNTTIWVWANIYAPRKETITIQWLNYRDDVLRATSVDISENRTNGFRVFDAKNIQQSGIYKVHIFNGAGDLIGRKRFTVE